jgi:hypothetical protein
MYALTSSDLQTFMNFFKANFGFGLWALPCAISYSGVIVSYTGAI